MNSIYEGEEQASLSTGTRRTCEFITVIIIVIIITTTTTTIIVVVGHYAVCLLTTGP
jgi:hypothetical protein